MKYRIHHTPNTKPTTTPDESWAQQTLRDTLLAAYQEQRRQRLWRNIWRAIWLILIISFFASLKQDNSNTPEYTDKDHTAIIRLTGAIGGSPREDQVEMLRNSMEAAYDNNHMKAIIIRADSPGGSPVVSNTAFNEIRRLKAQHKNIPVYVVAEDVCASGCYYIAAAADKIYADPASIVGSIGVIGGGFDFTGLMDKLGIKRRLKTAGSNKGMGDPFTPETPEQAAIWNEMLTQIHQEFIQAVKTGRGTRLNEKAYPDMFSGRIYTGKEAKAAGLIDDFGSIYSVARDVVGAPEMVDYTQESNADWLRRGLGLEMRTFINSWIDKISASFYP